MGRVFPLKLMVIFTLICFSISFVGDDFICASTLGRENEKEVRGPDEEGKQIDKTDSVSGGIFEKEKVASVSTVKKKRKFPFLIVLLGIAVTSTIAIYLIKQKSSKNDQSGPNYDTQVLGIQWVEIQSGEFQMGDNFNEGSVTEKPVHKVYLGKYFISKHEITFAQYDVFCEETGKEKPLAFNGRGTMPVYNVSWNDAQSFCAWLSDKTGKKIHLPTEAQWEKAARGTDQRRYPWGNGAPDCSLCNFASCGGDTQPVGSHPSGASPYGVMDMAGNVWEWCQDRFSDTYYQECFNQGTVINPQGPANNNYWYRVIKGGNSYHGAADVRSSQRYISNPSDFLNSQGFRIAQE